MDEKQRQCVLIEAGISTARAACFSSWQSLKRQRFLSFGIAFLITGLDILNAEGFGKGQGRAREGGKEAGKPRREDV